MSTTRPTVLIVDDDRVIRKILLEMLGLEGYRCETAADGAEGLEHMRGTPEEHLIVVTGLMMPGMDGWEMLRRADREGLLERHAVVIASGHAPFAAAINGLLDCSTATQFRYWPSHLPWMNSLARWKALPRAYKPAYRARKRRPSRSHIPTNSVHHTSP
jgi:CheY-like chemotaxis protein